MNDSSDRNSARRSVSLVPGVIYEWTPTGVMLVEAEDEKAESLPQPEVAPFQPGIEPVAGYHLAERIGDGCTGEVWRAIGPGGVAVALKFIAAGSPGAAQELRSLASMPEVRHANLVTIFGIWEQPRWTVIGMDLADGSLLDRWETAAHADPGGLDFAELIDWLRQAARGIDFLNEPRHSREGEPPVALIHRDIKPQNLLLVGGSVKVGDFGLVAPLGAAPTMPSGTGIDGVASLVTAYTAPEIRQGGLARQSDQYSLAATYCHLRGGRVPATPLAAGDPVDLSILPPLERPAVARALALRPAARWPTCSAFVEALVASVQVPSPSRPMQVAPWPTESSRAGAALSRPLALASLLAVAGAIAWSGWGVVAPETKVVDRPEPSTRPVLVDRSEPVAAISVEPVSPPLASPEPLVETVAIAPAEISPASAAPPVTTPPPLPNAEPVVVAFETHAEVVTPTSPTLSLADLQATVVAWTHAARDHLETRLAASRAWIAASAESAPAPVFFVGPPAPDQRPGRDQKPLVTLTPRSATILVRMPTSKAELVVRGEVGRGNPDEWYGPRRVIHSPLLTEAQDYLVGAFWFDPSGRPLVRSQPLKVEPGRSYEVDLRPEIPTAVEVPRSSAL